MLYHCTQALLYQVWLYEWYGIAIACVSAYPLLVDFQVKRQNRQVLAILKDSSKQWVKLGMNNNKGDVHGRNKSVKVNLYSWAK